MNVKFFKKLPNCLPGWLYHFTFPLAICERDSFSAHSPALDIVTIFHLDSNIIFKMSDGFLKIHFLIFIDLCIHT